MTAWIVFAFLYLATAFLQGKCVNAGNTTVFQSTSNGSVYPHKRPIKHEELDNIFLQLTVHMAYNGYLQDAWAEVHNLGYDKDVRFMEDFVAKLYKWTGSNMYSTLDILVNLNCTDYGKSVEAFHKELRKQDQLSNPDLFTFHRFLQKCAETEKRVRDTAEHVRLYTEKILDKWADSIQAQNFEHIHNFDYWSAGASLRIPDLVGKALAQNITNFASTLKFVNAFEYLEHKARGLSALVQELKEMGMEHSEEMLLISYWAHYLISQDVEHGFHNDYGFEILLAEIPSVLNQVFSMPRCTIKNLNTDEYLFAVGEPVYDGNGMVFTWIPGNRPAAAEWALFPSIDTGNGIHFLIKNKALTNDTYFLCDAVPTNRVVTCNDNQHRSKWALLPKYWNGLGGRVAGFMVKNMGSLRYMQPREKFERDKEPKRREVIISSVESFSSNHWQIECTH